MKKVFLHGLDSSGDGTKGMFFKKNFPDVMVPDFNGTLLSRLQALEKLTGGSDDLLLVGSSFGGLMATCFAITHPLRVKRIILLAPALNFPGFQVPEHPLVTPTYLLIGSLDQVTPAEKVLPLARWTFASLEVEIVEEDHLLHQSFLRLDWSHLFEIGNQE